MPALVRGERGTRGDVATTRVCRARAPRAKPTPGRGLLVGTRIVDRNFKMPKEKLKFDDLVSLVHWRLNPPAAADRRKKRADFDDEAEPTESLPDRVKLPVTTVLPGMMQILAVQAPKYRLEIVKLIESQASRRRGGDRGPCPALALFDAEPEVRTAALGALKREAAAQYGSKLLEGLRYPWPVVAERAAEAIVALDRTGLVPRLVEFLDEPRSRRPDRGRGGDQVPRRSRGGEDQPSPQLHPVPRDVGPERFPQFARPDRSDPGHRRAAAADDVAGLLRSGTPIVIANETYLRQDFSVMLAVENADPWPKMQAASTSSSARAC